ncbi:MAG: hypothetical protein QOF57_1437 [Frankiaceae bacterium]|nr:hypothetical protein [Frankiaceae bacterium]
MTTERTDTTNESYDVVVVGGGAAGLSAAVALGRFRRAVLVVDGGDPRNAPAGHLHNYLTRDGTPPLELLALGREEVVRYGGRVDSGDVTALRRDGDGFQVDIGTRVVGARRLLVATGLRDELPDIPGLAARWGLDVLHCPYCHGWEVRDRAVGVLATGPTALHQARMFRQLTDRVTLLTHSGPALTGEEREECHVLGIHVHEAEITEVLTGADGLTGVRTASGDVLPLDVLVVAPRFHARADLLVPLGVAVVDVRVGDHLIGTRIEADGTGATAVPGLWVAGNVTDPQAQVIVAAAAGLTAAAAINSDLLVADARTAIEAHLRQQLHGEAAWEERYRSRPQNWSGNVNAVLLAEAAGLRAGTALDAGAGEGADACWLAERGWRVTGLDISTTALERAAALAEGRGLDITWRHVDLSVDPAPATYDLVTAHYLHMPAEPRRRVFAHLAAAVAPGGTLLIVGHDLSDEGTTMPRPALAEMGWTAHEVAASLGEGWTIEVAEARPRTATDPEGREVTIRDAVLRARRTGP